MAGEIGLLQAVDLIGVSREYIVRLGKAEGEEEKILRLNQLKQVCQQVSEEKIKGVENGLDNLTTRRIADAVREANSLVQNLRLAPLAPLESTKLFYTGSALK